MFEVDLGHQQVEVPVDNSSMDRELMERLVNLKVGESIDTPIGKLIKDSPNTVRIAVDTTHIHKMIEKLVA